MSKPIKTRFPPSPTGYLHIGSLRTALYNYLYAKREGGSMILRVEDTDRTRYVPGAVESLIRTLDRMDITYQEGPRLAEDDTVWEEGDNGPYVQSERLDLYKKYAEQLLEEGHAYYCFCSRDRLDSLRKQQQLAKLPTKYDRHCLSLSNEEIRSKLSANEPHVIRLKVPEGKTTFEDIIRGTVTIANTEVDDQVLMKSDGYPTYHLAVVVDDHLMEVTHVIRGEEWLSSVPKHVMLYNAFGWDLPVMAHLPLILNKDRSKLSKRQGDVAVEDFLDKGYLPEALINFVALLGFNPKDDQEIYTLEELTELFDLTKVNKGGAVFDLEKLNWMNGQYIRALTPEQLKEQLWPFIARAGKEIEENMLLKIATVEQERLTLLGDIVEKIDDYQTLPEYDGQMLVWRKADEADAIQNLRALVQYLTEQPDETFTSVETVETALKQHIEANGLSNGNVLWPMRVALSGKSASPSPFELAWVLGKEETLSRLDLAIGKLTA